MPLRNMFMNSISTTLCNPIITNSLLAFLLKSPTTRNLLQK